MLILATGPPSDLRAVAGKFCPGMGRNRLQAGKFCPCDLDFGSPAKFCPRRHQFLPMGRQNSAAGVPNCDLGRVCQRPKMRLPANSARCRRLPSGPLAESAQSGRHWKMGSFCHQDNVFTDNIKHKKMTKQVEKSTICTQIHFHQSPTKQPDTMRSPQTKIGSI